MDINELSSSEAALKEVGHRLRQARIAHPLTQEELASRAGVSKRTIANLENGADVMLSSLIGVLRALGMLSRLDQLVPEEEVRPSELLAAKPRRQRVRHAKDAPSSAWKWGDER